MKKNNNRKEVLDWLKAIIIAFIFVWGIRFFLFTPIEVNGASMMPTFDSGDRVLVNKIGPSLTEFNRFDVIVFEATEDTNFIKRIIGLPGDHISYKNDVLLINGVKYNEPYLEEYKKLLNGNETFTEDFTLEEYLGEEVVPEGYLFVMGDNRQYSNDSRNPDVGFVSMDIVLGTTNTVIWPIEKLGSIKGK